MDDHIKDGMSFYKAMEMAWVKHRQPSCNVYRWYRQKAMIFEKAAQQLTVELLGPKARKYATNKKISCGVLNNHAKILSRKPVSRLSKLAES